MEKNIRILVVGNEKLPAILNALLCHNVSVAQDSAAGLREYIDNNKKQNFDLVFTSDIDLLKSVMELNPDQYAVMLIDEVAPAQIVQCIKYGANGILNQPLTAHKVQMELDKYMLLREDKKVAGL